MEEQRAWTDPRTGRQWEVISVPAQASGGGGPDPGPAPCTLVFRRGDRRLRVGYAGPSTLCDMRDADLVLLFDCTAAAAS